MRRSRRFLLTLGLVASIVGLGGADWSGVYTGSDAGPHRIRLLDQGSAVLIQELRITVDDGGGQCSLLIEDCLAALDSAAAAFAASACTARLEGHPTSCSGSIALDVQGVETAALAKVTSFTLQTSLNDWPVPVNRVPTSPSCGLGPELLVAMPLLWLARAGRRRRR